MFVIKSMRLKNLFFLFLSIIFACLLLINPSPCIASAKNGLNISLYLVLPSLFPFAVISSYIAGNLTIPKAVSKIFFKLFNIGQGSVIPLILGLISGFPVGAVLVSDMLKEKRLTADEASYLLPFCNALSPLFVIGVLGGGMLGSYKLGYFLYIIHLISLLLVAFLLKNNAPFKKNTGINKSNKTSFTAAIDKGIFAMLNVSACIIFFSVVLSMIKELGIFEIFGQFSSVLYGAVELTNGLNFLTLSDLPMRLKISLASFLCGFSGICIYLQVHSAVKNTKVSLSKYLIFKLLIGITAFLISWLLYPLVPFPYETSAISMVSANGFVSSFAYIPTAILLACRFLKRLFFDNR